MQNWRTFKTILSDCVTAIVLMAIKKFKANNGNVRIVAYLTLIQEQLAYDRWLCFDSAVSPTDSLLTLVE